MRGARTFLLVVATLAGAPPLLAATPPALAPALASALAPALADDPLVEIERLADEGEKFFKEAGDTDAPNSERKAARKEAYARLKEARKQLDALLDADESRTEELDPLYSRITMMLFWVKKEAAIGELEGGGPVVTTPPRKADTGGSGIGGASRDGDGRTPPRESGETGSGASSGGGHQPTADAAPEAPSGPTPADELAEITAYEQAHPGDVPGLHDLYTAFLATHSDPSLTEYGQALARREALDRKLKDVYRTLRDDDPDELADKDNRETERLVGQLVEDLAPGRDVAVRVRAASYLGSLGSTSGVTPLLDTLRDEKAGPVAEACAVALAAIGGRTMCNRLVRLKADEYLEGYVVDILGTVVKRGGPEGRIAGESLATYVLDRDEALCFGAIESLKEAGKPGALGLAMLAHVAPVEEVEPLIEHVGQQGEPRTAEYLAPFMKAGAGGVDKKHARAARKAIETLGKPSVRYLIPVLDNEDAAVWTAEMLRRLTDAKPSNDKRKTWERWYRKNRREFQ